MSTYLGGTGVVQNSMNPQGSSAAATQGNADNSMSNPPSQPVQGTSFGDLLTDWGGNLLDFVVGDDGLLDKMGDPSDPVGQLLNLGAASYISKYTQPNRPEVGYQGTIPKYTAVRERVNQPEAPTEGRRSGIMSFAEPGDSQGNPTVLRQQGDRYAQGDERRPGGKGRRYFSDTIFAKTPEDQEPMDLETAQKQAKKQALMLEGKSEEEADAIVNPTPAPATAATGGHIRKYAHGGIAGAHKGYYLGGKTDGMADQIPASINGRQEARLSDGEFVIPADVVSHLGNGNSDAGAQQLHGMMDNVRQARTGTTEQGKQIDPQKFMPKMAKGGLAQFSAGGSIQKFNTGSNTPVQETPVGQYAGTSGSLANWAGDYVTNMLGQGRALGEQGYEAYEGPLTAGTSTLESQAMTGILDLNNPFAGDSVTKGMGGFQEQSVTDEGFDINPYMNPYTDTVIDRTAADMQRQNAITQLQDRTAMTQAGAFGGSRDALMRAEAASNLSRNIGDMSAEQRAAAYNAGIGQFNLEQDRAKAAQEQRNQYGFDALAAQMNAGATQRAIASEGIAADYEQFREERDYPYKQVQYMQSLLQGLPVAAKSVSYTEPSALAELMQGQEGLMQLLDLFGYEDNQTNIGT